MDEKIDLIIKKLNSLEMDILYIKNKLDNERLEKHIDFIENVYAKLKAPIEYISNKINVLSIKEK